MTNPTAEQLMYKLRLTLEPLEYEAHVLALTTATSVSSPWKMTLVSHFYSPETLRLCRWVIILCTLHAELIHYKLRKIKYLNESCRWEICTSFTSIWTIFHIQILAKYFTRCGDQCGLWPFQALCPGSKLVRVVGRLAELRLQPIGRTLLLPSLCYRLAWWWL
jgi:hypothetical protein